MIELFSHFKDDLKDYKPIPFWSWNNKLDNEELKKQIGEMKQAGIGGFIMHARTGLATKYLSDEWFDCIKTCLNEAKKLDMNAWIYDENGWPSGFVEGRLLKNPEYRANYLEYEIKDCFDDNAYAVYALEGGKATRIRKGCKAEKYHCIYLKSSPANTDILNPEVVDEFIKQTHEEYYKRFSDRFGKELKGFFTDEPQYYRWGTPFTKAIIEDYKKLYNEDVKDSLIYLFIKSEYGYQFRYRYFSMLNNYYVTNFYKKLYDWCSSHNCMLTGHSVEETGLHTQMWGGGAVMPTYEFEHIPGIDCLGRGCGTELMPKQVSSVAEQLGKKFVLTETFGCSGYDVTPYELKSIAEYQYFNGVNIMCHHLLPYSISSQGKYDHPPVFSRHGNWWNEFKIFNDYFTKLGYIIANTEEITDVAVINPMKSIYLDYIRSSDYESVKELEDSFREFLLKLRHNGILYQLIDETILEKYGKAEYGSIKAGKKSYSTIILPPIYTLSQSTNKIINDFTACGGKLYIEKCPKYLEGKKFDFKLTSNISFGDILDNRYLKFNEISEEVFVTARKGDFGEFLFVKNLSHIESGFAAMENISKNYIKYDIENQNTEIIRDKIYLKPGDSAVLYKQKVKETNYKNYKEYDITGSFKFKEMSDNYLIIDRANISFDGIAYEETKDVQQIFENLLRKDYNGQLYVKFSFTIKDTLKSLTLLLEQSHYQEIFVNSKKITLKNSGFDIKFAEADILPYVVKGSNEIIYKINYSQHDGVNFALFDPNATESLRNCLSYDTEIERIYLKGGFKVNGDLSISKPDKELPLCENLQEKGLPFFYGNISYEGSFNYDCGDVFLQLEGRYMAANITINGTKCDMVLDSQKNITNLLQKGSNKIEISIKSSLRNLMGPHHFKPQKEPMGVGPYMFTLRGSWKEGISGDYTQEYNIVNFGLKYVKIFNE